MRWVRFAVIVILGTILQAGAVDVIALTPSGIKPDLPLILLVFFAVYSNTTEAIITSFVIGFAADLISPVPLMGPRMISFGIFGTALAYLHRVIAIRTMPYQALAILIIGFCTAALTHLLTILKDPTAAANIHNVLFWTPIYSAVLGPFLFLPSAWWMRIKKNRFRKM